MLDQAANNESFAEFVDTLFERFGGEPLTVLLDNLAVHFHENVKAVYAKHNV